MAENQDTFADDPKISDEEADKVQLFSDIDPDAATPEQVKTVIKTAKTLQAQKKVWRGRAIDPTTGKPFKDLLTEAQAKPNTAPAAATDDETKTAVKQLQAAEEKRTFGHLNQLSPEETDHVFAYAQGVGKKPTEVLDNPFVKNALEALRQNAANDTAIPGSSSRAPRVEGKSFGEMKEEDRRKNFGKIASGLQQRR